VKLPFQNWDGWQYPHNQAIAVNSDPRRWQLQVYNGLKNSLHLVRDWSLAVDGGGFVGMWTKPLSFLFKKVVVFEPNPAAFVCLEKNCGHLPNVELINKALGHEARARVGIHDTAPGPSVNLYPDDQQHKASTYVEMVTLDTYGLTPGYLKLDLEGYEYRAMTGGQQTIERGHPVIVVEHSGHASRYPGSLAYEKFFTPINYKKVVDGDDQVWTWQLKT
jgi:FkbM family methyltransferase